MFRNRFSQIACALLLTASAFAIVIRHDRPDARYTELAKEFDAYGDVVEAGSTLIAPKWLLTAGHVAKEISPYTSYAMIGGQRYVIDRVIMHPVYASSGMRGPRDLALLRLTKPVKGIEPIQLYRSEDEEGKIVTFFGRGQTGNGNTGPTGEDGKMRGATNRIESADASSLFFQFDKPETATELEGISGPGDSGGPALLKIRGRWAIAGISSANRGNGKGECRYDTTEIYARVSTAAAWIDETMKSTPESTVLWKISAPFKDWPKTRAGEIASALIGAFNSGDAAKNETFNQEYRDPQALKRATPEKRAASFAEMTKRIGKLTVLEYAEGPSGRMLTLLRNAKGEHYQLSLYFFDAENKRFDGFWIGAAMPRAK